MTDADVAEQPRFETVAQEICEMLTGCDIGGYGVRGDITLIEREMADAGVAWSPAGAAIIDGLRMWQVLEPRKLDDAYERFVGALPENGQRHDAVFDVELTSAVIDALRNGRSLEQVHDETNDQMVDVGGKFRLDQGRRIVFAFGRYRGAVAIDHPQFLEWMLSKDFPRSTLDVARRLLDEYWDQHAAAESAAADGQALHETDQATAEDDSIPF